MTSKSVELNANEKINGIGTALTVFLSIWLNWFGQLENRLFVGE